MTPVLSGFYYFSTPKLYEMSFTESENFLRQDYTTSALSKGEYDNCTFTGCNFSGSDLSYIIFSECEFTDCNFSMAKTQGTAFKDVDFKNCKMTGFNFSTAEPFLLSMNFTECQLNLSSFYGVKLKKARFKDCILHESDLTQADFTQASFAGCDFKHTVFENTVLEKADLRTAINYSIDPEQNRIKKAKFSLPEVTGLLDRYAIEIE